MYLFSTMNIQRRVKYGPKLHDKKLPSIQQMTSFNRYTNESESNQHGETQDLDKSLFLKLSLSEEKTKKYSKNLQKYFFTIS